MNDRHGREGLAARDEEWLIARARARDGRAFQEIYERQRPRLVRFLCNLLPHGPLVEEVLNDTMMAVWEGLNGFDGRSALSTWIFAIAYRKAVRARMRNDDPVEASEDQALRLSDDVGPEDSAGRRQMQQAIVAALAGLSRDQRAVVDLTYFHGLPYRDIARIMNCPIDTVKTRMFHARRHLRTTLTGDLTDWV